jgi:O-antigen/teichoic acid export membrane protein
MSVAEKGRYAPATSDPAGAERDSPLSSSALGGVMWNWGGSAVLIVAQVASTAATARLVAPREFGLYATALAAAGFTSFFTLVAVGPGIQRRSRLGEKTAGTALTLSLAGSLVIAGALWLGAPLWANAWGVPDATWAVRILAVALLFSTSATVPIALIRRRLQFDRAAIVETGSVVAGLAAGVSLAISLHSAVALALGQAIGSVTLLMAASLIVRDEVRFSFNRDDARELFAFASQVGGLNFFAYFTTAIPSWFTARAFGPFALGLYSRAYLIAVLPAEYAITSIMKVIYPLYGRVREDLARTKTLVDEALTLTTGFVWPLFGLIAGASPVIVAVLLGARWHEAASLLPFFVLIACGWVPCWLLTNAAEAFGWMRVIAARQVAYFVGIAAALVTVHLADLGLKWLLLGVALAEWAAYALTLQPFIRRNFLDAGLVTRRHMVHGGVALAAFGAAAGCAEILDGAPLSAKLAGQVGVAAVVIGTLVLSRPRIPATRVLARRLGAPANQSIARAGWPTLMRLSTVAQRRTRAGRSVAESH